MSMISSLIDELRKSADEWNGSNMFELARMCSEAADTIWQLRDDLQRANEAVRDAEHDESRAWDRVRKAEAENAKLRELLAKARDPRRIGGTADPESFVYAIEQLREFRWQHATNDEEAIPYINNVADAHERENAKLRELVKDTLPVIENNCAMCAYLDECTILVDCKCIALKRLRDRMRELGGRRRVEEKE